ncbi:glyoxalase [Hyunsoonleella flava]|uniref:Glyoxalase n=1 Tax=Hyunsoonleella flava TaxID=2527939 RepID=A0A4Q9FF67_9FLAO|nr:glyoxalase [Hyunsoonleella flava]TBN05411.1 glyoxalase [Hyunsoonleella flava]
MFHNIKSLRSFIGAKDYSLSRQFYNDFGFEELKLSDKMSYFKSGDFGFYLQDYNIKDWIDNSMIFMEVEHLETHLKNIKALHLENKYKDVKISKIHYNDWGNEYFIHDPSGVLWLIGEFKNP